MDINTNEIVLFDNGELMIEVNVTPADDTVWLNRNQLSLLYQTDRTVIGRHIRNIYSSGELDYKSTCAKIAHVPDTRERLYDIEYFNLDIILAIGYRVNAKQGMAFRKWASKILKQYIYQGYSVNEEKLRKLDIAVQIMKRVYDRLDSKQILDVIESYSRALNLLDDYDHESIQKPKGGKETTYRLSYIECRQIIDNMKFAAESNLFGYEKDESFQSSIGAIYQTSEGIDVYPSLEEKAGNLLYFIVKNHSFTDGNKRIAAAIFLYFLDKNQALYLNGMKVIEDHTLVALVIMIAESAFQEKEIMVRLVMNFIHK